MESLSHAAAGPSVRNRTHGVEIRRAPVNRLDARGGGAAGSPRNTWFQSGVVYVRWQTVTHTLPTQTQPQQGHCLMLCPYGRPAAPPAPPPPAPKAAFENLEDEMANLLGRPKPPA